MSEIRTSEIRKMLKSEQKSVPFLVKSKVILTKKFVKRSSLIGISDIFGCLEMGHR